MFNYVKVTTKDRRGGTHQYKQPDTEAIPVGHEIVDFKRVGTFSFAEIIGDENADMLKTIVTNMTRQRQGVRVRGNQNARKAATPMSNHDKLWFPSYGWRASD